MMVRRLSNGEGATIVKNFYTAGELIDAAGRAGIDVEIGDTGRFFQFGLGEKR